jgi:hypothetical protein
MVAQATTPGSSVVSFLSSVPTFQQIFPKYNGYGLDEWEPKLPYAFPRRGKKEIATVRDADVRNVCR